MHDLPSIRMPPQPTPRHHRTFLFLQGPASPLFSRLGSALARRGHVVRRINLNLGDRLFWRGPASAYRGHVAGWHDWLATFMARNHVTDIALFGDRRPYHEVAIAMAQARGLRVHVFEEGYIRPDWITVEQGGVNGRSALPRDPADLLGRAARLPPPPTHRPVPDDMLRRSLWDVAYQVATVVGRPLYRGYVRHRPEHPFVEYASWLRRLAGRKAARRQAEATLARRPSRRYLVPLQLESDYQIRAEAAIGGVAGFVRSVVASFAAHAPADAEMVFKGHPLDNGLVSWAAVVRSAAAAHGVVQRVSFVDGGDLSAWLRGCSGVVLVNSTAGIAALRAGVPLMAVGTAIYRMPGLTFEGPLDRFWTKARPPDPALVAALEAVVIAETQVNGGFFDPAGLDLAVAGALTRLEARASGIARSEPETVSASVAWAPS